MAPRESHTVHMTSSLHALRGVSSPPPPNVASVSIHGQFNNEHHIEVWNVVLVMNIMSPHLCCFRDGCRQ